jgi:CubicO group peptidase (beta-lactamase class C family)
MVGTAADYARFCNMLLAGGVTSSGERILGVKTIEFATSNHLPAGKGLLDMIIDPKVQYSETAANGGERLRPLLARC